MGAFADDAQALLREELAARSERAWVTEHRVGRTPVDVAAPDGDVAVFVELEFRRADPANNTVKIARHAAEGEVEKSVVLIQAFSRYYETERGISSKRANAAFVGGLASDGVAGFAYRSLDFDVAPPKRGDDPPDNWEAAVESLAARVASVDVDAV